MNPIQHNEGQMNEWILYIGSTTPYQPPFSPTYISSSWLAKSVCFISWVSKKRFGILFIIFYLTRLFWRLHLLMHNYILRNISMLAILIHDWLFTTCPMSLRPEALYPNSKGGGIAEDISVTRGTVRLQEVGHMFWLFLEYGCHLDAGFILFPWGIICKLCILIPHVFL